MDRWIARGQTEQPPSIFEQTVVDVLYEDDAGYRRMPAKNVEWNRTTHPVVLWRIADEPLTTADQGGVSHPAYGKPIDEAMGRSNGERPGLSSPKLPLSIHPQKLGGVTLPGAIAAVKSARSAAKIKVLVGLSLCIFDWVTVAFALLTALGGALQPVSFTFKVLIIGAIIYVGPCLALGCWRERWVGDLGRSAIRGGLAVVLSGLVFAAALLALGEIAQPKLERLVLNVSVAAVVTAIVRAAIAYMLGPALGLRDTRVVLCEMSYGQTAVPAGAIDAWTMVDPEHLGPEDYDLLARMLQGSERVIIRCAPERRQLWVEALCGMNIAIELEVPELAELHPVGLKSSTGTPTVLVRTPPLALGERAMKRAFDLIGSLAALVILFPLLLIVAIAIKIDSPGPVLFRQPRIGRQNRTFQIYKFRSMRADRCDVDGVQSTGRSDERITRVGRIIRNTSIDELPQLFNVLIGDMSLVGPRPHAVSSTADGELFWKVDTRYWTRHACKPGITGLAQVNGYRGATEKREDLINRVSSDIEYASRWSLFTDLGIILKTCRVLVHSNAF